VHVAPASTATDAGVDAAAVANDTPPDAAVVKPPVKPHKHAHPTKPTAPEDLYDDR
jgi:hypothetical protein